MTEAQNNQAIPQDTPATPEFTLVVDQAYDRQYDMDPRDRLLNCLSLIDSAHAQLMHLDTDFGTDMLGEDDHFLTLMDTMLVTLQEQIVKRMFPQGAPDEELLANLMNWQFYRQADNKRRIDD